MRRAVGIDLALRKTGVAGVHGNTYTIDSGERRGVDRLHWVVTEIMGALVPTEPELVAVEGYAFGAPSASVYQIGELGGVLRVALHRAAMGMVVVPPAVVKKYATGKGAGAGSSKLAVAWEAKTQLAWEGTSDDEADALWLRAIALHALGEPQVRVTKVRSGVIDALDLPWRS